ncbi:MAG: SRPBCC family protein [Methylobacter sp.]
MVHFLKAMEIDVLVPIAYEQWNRLEQFPEFMDSVNEVRRLDDSRLHWRGTLGGKPVESDIEITERVEDYLIVWRNPAAPANHGSLRFEAMGNGRTLLTVDVEYETESPELKASEALGMIAAQFEDALESFKTFVEARTKSGTHYRAEPDPNSVSPA